MSILAKVPQSFIEAVQLYEDTGLIQKEQADWARTHQQEVLEKVSRTPGCDNFGRLACLIVAMHDANGEEIHVGYA